MISAYVDRFEEEYAVLLLGESMKKVNFPRAFLPDDIGEGDYIRISVARDAAATEAAAAEARALLHDR
ncbi:DUF3006 domain-containing protein [Selenomonas sp. F0473]|uniref:DUF3006 domain-containing protein n=1 Tax=Selenomonas sp. F0473 TaxID=999423 RepID=UPI00029EB3BB|nr:DUF3006 domain-containing protein [Selenomonas sp. F0473]EKU71824.1 hypothetical protein HMPREF9161_00509 [Selenomonas sp. F0473]